MQRTRAILLVALFGVAASAVAGDLWIDCESGLDIFLDGELVGVSEEAENGKHLPAVSSGNHTIRIEKDGFAPAEFSIAVGPASNQVVIGELGPEIEDDLTGAAGREEVEQLVGTIEITSDPRECNVKFAGQRIPKKQPILTIPGVPVGEHKLWFESSGTVLSETVLVQAAQTAKVRVDFRNQRVAAVDSESDQSGSESAGEEKGPEAEPECIEYWVQVMRTSSFEEIEAVSSILKDLGFPDYHQKIITIEDDGTLPVYKIRVGPVPRKSAAKHPAHLLKQAGFRSVWIVPEECQSSPVPTPKQKFKPIH